MDGTEKMYSVDLIEGERVYLRRITSEDTDKILCWRNMPHVVERFIYREEVTRADHERWLKEQVGTGKVVQFIIVVKESGKEIGSQYFTHIDLEKSNAEFGIFIGEIDALGKKYGTEVLQLALKYAFEKMKLKEVYLRVLEDNERAIRVYEKCGLKICKEASQEVLIHQKLKKVLVMKIERSNDYL